ncbi:MAG: radical SAM protein, partial [Candidatus Omnitrophica bacterium]|nr:radical SAM protein [Candidatus Omnitrophota bacterium]
MINLIYSDSSGKIFEDPEHLMMGGSGFNYIIPSRRELIKLPPISKLFFIPGSLAIGLNKKTKEIEALSKSHYAVSAFLPPGYLRTLLPAVELKKPKRYLPLWAYTAVGIKKDKFYTCAVKIDKYENWDPGN